MKLKQLLPDYKSIRCVSKSVVEYKGVWKITKTQESVVSMQVYGFRMYCK